MIDQSHVPVLSVRHVLISIVATLMLSSPVAHAASFSDVPENHPQRAAIEYMKEKGIFRGYDDGTFKPGNLVNRAEIATIIARSLASAEKIDGMPAAPYEDVPAEAWYSKPVEYARAVIGIIDSPPEKPNFFAEKPVIQAEFLKMFLLSQKVDPNNFGEIRLPLAYDVTNPDEWYYPYIRNGLALSMFHISSDGKLSPAKQMSRGDIAQQMYHFFRYKDNKRTQALLTLAEDEIRNLKDAIGEGEVIVAEHASARALVITRGAHNNLQNEPIVIAALKITEAYRALVRGYRAGLNDNFDETIRLAGEAWHLADAALAATQDVSIIAQQVKGDAEGLAKNARDVKAQRGL